MAIRSVLLSRKPSADPVISFLGVSRCMTGYVVLQVMLAVVMCVGATGGSGEDQAPVAATEEQDDAGFEGFEELTGLMETEVISVARKQQKINEIAAAITVVTSEDIRRSGAQTLPEAFKNLPGVDAARQSAGLWGISTRGFNDVYADKLLVMIDGRSIYTPLFGGVHWEVQDLVLENIERIEVIRGPGASVWGSNAVNGVINIITKSSRDTRGVLASAGFGTQLQRFGAFRFGDAIGDNLFFRYSGKYLDHDEFYAPATDSGAGDGWEKYHHDLRMDWHPNDKNHLMFEAGHYYGDFDEIYTLASPTPPYLTPTPVKSLYRGGNSLLAYKHFLNPDADFSVKFYYDNTRRNNLLYNYKVDILDLDLESRILVNEHNELVFGGGYRNYSDRIASKTPNFTWNPIEENWGLWNTFIQDEVRLMDEKLLLTFGSKFEGDYFSGFQFQPSVRGVWKPTSTQSLWASFSRATRTPARGKERDADVVGAAVPPGVVHPFLPALVVVSGNDNLEAESLLAYELGYRTQATPRLGFDVSVFYSDYNDLIGRRELMPTMGGTPANPYINIPSISYNSVEGYFYGVETAVSYMIDDWWKTQWNYTFTGANLYEKGSFMDVSLTDYEGMTPRHRVGLRSYMSFPGNIELDVSTYYKSSIGGGVFNSQNIPDHFGLDVRLGWRPSENFEISLVGQEIQEQDFADFASIIPLQSPSNVQRNIFLKLTYSY